MKPQQDQPQQQPLGHICLACMQSEAVIYFECLCCFCTNCYQTKVEEKVRPYFAKKDLQVQFSCPLCKQHITAKMLDAAKPQIRQQLVQLNGNPATMLKSTVRNLEFKEKQMLAKNKLLTVQNNFLQALLREIVRRAPSEIDSLPRELIEQDKFNFLSDLKQSFRNRQLGRNTEGKKSRSEHNITETNCSLRNSLMPGVSKPHSKSMKSLLYTAAGPNTNTGPQQAPPSTAGQYYGFEMRNIKKNAGAPQTGQRDTAKALEEKLNSLGQNNRAIRPKY